jgi:hypothetical protein
METTAMPDDIAHWKRELAKLQVALNELEAAPDEMAEKGHMKHLKRQIADLDRHIEGLEKRRNA